MQRMQARSHGAVSAAISTTAETNVSGHAWLIAIVGAGFSGTALAARRCRPTMSYWRWAIHHPRRRDGVPVDRLCYLGPWLRARDWEATAVPELREHATGLARLLVHRHLLESQREHR
jgi:uncharacterized NAD(P)/FAD-binding protein YdhS